ncbi:MAG: 30S ribosomal protein S17 [Planctomycetota bacterium]
MREQNRKTLLGTVHADKMMKTITVDVERRYKHPKYGKFMVKTRRFAVHDERNEAHAGDRVEIMETRPLSKNKRWRLLRVLERGHAAGEEATA